MYLEMYAFAILFTNPQNTQCKSIISHEHTDDVFKDGVKSVPAELRLINDLIK